MDMLANQIPEVQAIAMFYAFSTGAAGLLGILLLIGLDSSNVRSNRWLGAFYMILGCSFAQLFLEGFGFKWNVVIHLLELPRWAMLPCLYMAVKYYTSPGSQIENKFLHFVPFLLFLVFSEVYLMPRLFNAQGYLTELPRWIGFVVQYFFSFQMIFYWVLCLVQFRRHQKKLRMISSFTQKVNLAWLGYLLAAFLILIIIRGASLFNLPVNYYSPILYFIGVLLLAYPTLTQRSIYNMAGNG